MSAPALHQYADGYFKVEAKCSHSWCGHVSVVWGRLDGNRVVWAPSWRGVCRVCKADLPLPDIGWAA